MARAQRPAASTRAVDVNDDAWRHRLLAATMVGAAQRRGQAPASTARPLRSDRNRARSGAISGHPQHHGRHGCGQDGDRRREHRHRKRRPPQQPLTTGLRGRRPRQGRGHCWSYLDAHHRMMLLPSPGARAQTCPRPSQRASGLKSCSWGCGCKKTRSQTRVERSAILLATGERRVNAKRPAARHRNRLFNRARASQ